MEYEIDTVTAITQPNFAEITLSMWLMYSIAGVIVAGLVIFLLISFNKRKNNKNDNLVYEDQMDEQELKNLDDEIN
tara:strand:- start:634 stop:861 length:228 start_codon:yes stop_codon:yes gene_type:complete